MSNWTPSLAVRARAEQERRRRIAAALTVDTPTFLARTKIEVQTSGDQTALVPFVLWPAQRDQVLPVLARDRLVVLLKARQLGISWLVCGAVLHTCLTSSGQTWLLFSQGQLESNELTRRIGVLYAAYDGRLPPLVKDNTQELEWTNGSRVLSLPATRRAGRSFAASGVVLDEWAFMLWSKDVLGAVKPTIDAGGKLFIISSADGENTPYHSFWNAAASGSNGYTPLFLPWTARPDRGPGWRAALIREAGGDATTVNREYPETPEEAFTNAAGRVFDQWTAENVTEDAEYEDGAGPIVWFLDDGYSAGSQPQRRGIDPQTLTYAADAHPRVFLLAQVKPDGRICVFAEHYACLMLSDQHIQAVRELPYPAPDYVAHGPGAAEIRGRLFAAGLAPRQARTGDRDWVEESIKELQRALAPDANDWRRVLVHPRCSHLRKEMAAYRRDDAGGIIKAFDHGPDALRGGLWTLRRGM